MKKPENLFILIGLIFATSCIFNSEGRKQFKTQMSSQIQDEIEASIDSYQWQFNGDERQPVIAATAEELARLKAAWNTSGEKHEVLARRFSQADKAIIAGLTFPPEGGQHGQWYQCDSCQRALETVDPHHHRCPQCGKVYSGFPYDNVLYLHIHDQNFRNAEDAAWAWAVTGDKKYANFAAAVLLGYAERYLNYPMIEMEEGDKNVDVAALKFTKYITAGHIESQSLDEAVLMVSAVTTYDLIYNSKVLTGKEKKQIEENLVRPMSECINVDKNLMANHQSWYNASLLYAGAVLGEKQMMKQGILDEKTGFLAQMDHCVTPEGMWWENSWGYHYYALRAMTYLAEGARRMGINLYKHEMLRKMYLLPFDYMMSDRTLPRFGDAGKISPSNPRVNEKAYAIYRDKRLLSVLPTEPNWDMIVLDRKPESQPTLQEPSSKLFPDAGHAILATNGPGKLTVATTFGRYAGFHGHLDKLSFVFFGFGQELGVDPGNASPQAYRLPIHLEWYKATAGHNTVLVDGKSQNKVKGQLLAYAANASYAAVSADAGQVFENVTHRRFLLLSPTYLLVIDELQATDGKEHTYDWLYHNKGQNASCNLSGGNDKVGDSTPGYAYLKNISAFKIENEQPFCVSFPDEKITTQLTMLGQQGDKVFTATGPLAKANERAPLVIVRRKGQVVYFITVIEPVLPQKQPDVKGLELINSHLLSVSIFREGEEDIISFTGENLENFSVSNKGHSFKGKVVLKTEK